MSDGGTPIDVAAVAAVELSIVVGVRVEETPAAPCLSALGLVRREGVELIVVATEPVSMPGATVIVRPGALVPELWAEGIRRATGIRVALLSGGMVPAPDWADRWIASPLADAVAAGGAIDPAARLRLRDWAAFFCRYTPFMAPILGAAALELPADHACYRRDVLVQYAPWYADGFWEPTVHRAMRADGHRVEVRPEPRVSSARGLAYGALARQRIEHGRHHGTDRARSERRVTCRLRVVSAPLVPFVMTLRVLRAVARKRRHRVVAVASAPLLFGLYVCWSVGEAQGRLALLRSGRDS